MCPDKNFWQTAGKDGYIWSHIREDQIEDLFDVRLMIGGFYEVMQDKALLKEISSKRSVCLLPRTVNVSRNTCEQQI